VNYKAYRKAIGKNSADITRKIEEAGCEEEIAVVPQTADLNRIDTELTKYSQHIDGVGNGSYTGSTQAEAVKESGATGSLINHSERRLDGAEIKAAVKKCRELGIDSIVCGQTPEECEKYSELKPDYVAFEPPELIGGKTAVSTAEPGLISEAVEKTGDTPVLAGAGIKSREDVEKAVELGCKGVLVASGIIKSSDVQEKVEELCRGL
jgi:triosephosphate isomerase